MIPEAKIDRLIEVLERIDARLTGLDRFIRDGKSCVSCNGLGGWEDRYGDYIKCKDCSGTGRER